MTSFNLLHDVHPGELVGVYVIPVMGSDEPVTLLDIYRGEVPAHVQQGDAQIYEFMPIPGAEGDVSGEPLAVAAIDSIEKAEDGHINANLAFVVSGSESASDAVALNPVTEGGSRFGRLFQLLTSGEDVDRLLMEPTNTNVSQDQLHRLGFKTVEGSRMLQLDLPAADDRNRTAA